MFTSLLPMSPVPPITTVFMMNFLVCYGTDWIKPATAISHAPSLLFQGCDLEAIGLRCCIVWRNALRSDPPQERHSAFMSSAAGAFQILRVTFQYLKSLKICR